MTFTLPSALRPLAWQHQKTVYNRLFECVSTTLKDFNPGQLGAEMGLTAVLHTHNRRLDYHPHLHVVVPGGGIDEKRKQWKKKKGKYLFNERALAKVFRARFLDAIHQAGLAVPKNLPDRWVVHCAHVGKGQPAFQYLARYLYRGVLSEKDILADHDGQVTFRYRQSKTGETRYRTLNGEDFCWLILQHVLPKGFRRVRDYGFLHGNAKSRLKLVQRILRALVEVFPTRAKPVYTCRNCQTPMLVVGLIRPIWSPG